MARQAVVMMLAPVVMAGCGTRGSSAYADLEPPRQAVGGLEGRRCHYVQAPEVPATIDAMTRPGTRGTLLFWARDAAPSDTVELSVRYREDGKLSWVRAIRSTMTDERVAELERILDSGLTEDGPSDWGVRMLIVEGRVEELLPAVICEAEQRSQVSHVAPPVGTSLELAEARQARGREIVMQVSLDATGRVLEVRLTTSSGSRLMDQYALDLTRAHRYEPRLHDGFGVASTLPIRLRVRWR